MTRMMQRRLLVSTRTLSRPLQQLPPLLPYLAHRQCYWVWNSYCSRLGAAGQSRISNVVASTSLRASSSSSSNAGRQKSAIYAIGEGWTGALGTGRLDQSIAGHDDSTNDANTGDTPPVLMYETSDSDDNNQQSIQSCHVGWGHTAFVVQEARAESNEETNTALTNSSSLAPSSSIDDDTVQTKPSRHKLLVTGRPHDFAALLRLQRLPRRLRHYAVHQTYRSVQVAGQRDEQNGPNQTASLFNPTDWVDRLVTYFSDMVYNNASSASTSSRTRNTTMDPTDWDVAKQLSFLATPTVVDMPLDDNDGMTTMNPTNVVCSAGLTAISTESGTVYCMGLNGMGQCGVGYTSNNVWTPSARVTGLSRDFAYSGQRRDLVQSYPIQQVALGLQHGLALNTNGEMFSWGKGERGQLGQDSTIESETHTAVPILKAVSFDQIMTAASTADMDSRTSGALSQAPQPPPTFHRLGRISQIAAGMIHSAALEADTNAVYIWGKNTLPLLPNEKHEKGKPASDARLPVALAGLPQHRTVLQVSCGSHHTSMLLDDGSVWAVGIATDSKLPIHEPICLIEAGIVDLSTLTQFAAHMDRTTVVFEGQVLQVHLWSDVDNQKVAVFTPSWVDALAAHDSDFVIREVHRSWLHTAIVGERR